MLVHFRAADSQLLGNRLAHGGGGGREGLLGARWRCIATRACADARGTTKPRPMSPRWSDARVLPGARRLLQHARDAGLKVAVATSTSRATFGERGGGALFSNRAQLAARLVGVRGCEGQLLLYLLGALIVASDPQGPRFLSRRHPSFRFILCRGEGGQQAVAAGACKMLSHT